MMFEKMIWRARALRTWPTRLRYYLSSEWESKGWRGGWTEVESYGEGRDIITHRCSGYKNKETGEKVYLYAGPRWKSFVPEKHLNGDVWDEGHFERRGLFGGTNRYDPLEEVLSNET